MKYKPISKHAITAGDIVKLYRSGWKHFILKVDSHPTNSGSFTGHDATGRKYYHVYLHRDVEKAWTRA